MIKGTPNILLEWLTLDLYDHPLLNCVEYLAVRLYFEAVRVHRQSILVPNSHLMSYSAHSLAALA